MAIPYPLAEFICHEHLFKPLPKRVCLLGRQTMPFGPDQLGRLARKFDLPLDTEQIELDTKTIFSIQNPDKDFVTDTSFFNMLGVDTIEAIDFNDSEGANIIWDMTKAVPEELHGKFDFIFNGSVLDNIWDPPELLRNISRLLAPGGRIVHVETGTAMPYSYSAISPSWYFDYYVMNKWQDCQIYFAAAASLGQLATGPWSVMGFDPSAENKPDAFTPGVGDNVGISVVVAEKAAHSTVSTDIIQSHYRTQSHWDDFKERAKPIINSERSYYLGPNSKAEPIAAHRNAWVSCGQWGV